MNITAFAPVVTSVAEAALPHFFPKADKAAIKTAVDNLTPALTASAVAIVALVAALKTVPTVAVVSPTGAAAPSAV